MPWKEVTDDEPDAEPLTFTAQCSRCEWSIRMEIPDATRYSQAAWRMAWLGLAERGREQVEHHLRSSHGVIAWFGRICGVKS